MPDVVYCHLCYHNWFKDEWGLICPHCENEATEIVVVEDDPPTIEGNFGTTEPWPYGGYSDDEEVRLREEQTIAGGDSKSESSTEEALEEVVVAVMGVTGSGKSTFIRTMTANDNVHVGHGLESDTSEVNSYRFTHQSTEFVLVDTPGFDDTSCSDEKIMTRVLQWLESSFRSGARLNGLIYLHRIIDPKMQGSSLNNMRMFRKLCGPECFGNIILATTFWDDIPAELGAQREKELKGNDEFWGQMVKKGSEVVRLGTDKQSGMKLLMKIAKKSKITLQSQHEMVEENRSAQETAAAQSIYEEVMRQREEFERKIEQQRIENERELERRRIERQHELESGRIYAAEQEKKRAILEALLKREQEAAWQAEYERKQRELLEAEKKADRERQRLAAIERRQQEALEAHRQEQNRLGTERQRHYKSYSCQRNNVSSLSCDKCSKSVKNDYYYHCCFCNGDNYDQCNSCGGCCPVTEHPYMKKRFKSEPVDDDCILM